MELKSSRNIEGVGLDNTATATASKELKRCGLPSGFISKWGLVSVIVLCIMCGCYILFMMGYVSASSSSYSTLAVHGERFHNSIKRILGYGSDDIHNSSYIQDFRNTAKRNKLLGNLHPSVTTIIHKSKPTSKSKIIPSTNPSKIVTTTIHPSPPPPPKPLARPNSCTSCNNHDFNYVINEVDVCAKGEVDLLVLILSVIKKKPQRDVIRQTWASVAKGNTANLRYVFLFGKSPDPGDNVYLKEESVKYHDILQEDFKDSYNNLTLKTLMGFKWAASHCKKAKYVLKIDDDMWANTPKILQKIQAGFFDKLIKDKAYGGYCFDAGPIRDRRSKWFASRLSYPSNAYPRFCAGPGYIISSKVLSDVYRMSFNVPFFHLEDVYIGLCIKKLRYSSVSIAGFHNYRVKYDVCGYKNNVMTSHQVSGAELKQVWNASC